MTGQAWQRYTLFAALLILGVMYVLTYLFFRANSRDFAGEQFNERARDYARAHLIDVPATLKFTSGSPDIALLGSGWNRPAPEGTWTGLEDVWMSLGLHRTQGPVGIVIRSTAFLSRRHKSMQVRIDVDGSDVGTFQQNWTDPARPFALCISSAREQHLPLMLHIHIKHAAVPFELHQGRDLRLLGLLLHSVELSDGCPSTQP
jgi:hypothetical protein